MTASTEQETGKHNTPLPESGAGLDGALSNQVHKLQERLRENFGSVQDEKLDQSSPAGACLKPLLLALGWSGEERHLVEALPHFERVSQLEGLRTVLAALNYKSEKRKVAASALKPSMLPCLLLHKGNLSVVLEILDDGRLLVFDGAQNTLAELTAPTRILEILLIREIGRNSAQVPLQRGGWIQSVLVRFKPTFATLLLLSLGINILALMVPVYIMAVYQMAIGTKSFLTLLSLLGGALLVLSAEMALRIIRGRAIAYLGARVESLVTLNAFQRLLFLPVEATETASIATQVTRLKQYQNIKGLFTGTLASAVLDLPFISLFIVATFLIGGVLGFIPAALVVVYAVLAAITVPMASRHMKKAGAAKTKMRNFLMETTGKHRSIRDFGAQNVWLKRYEGLAGEHMLTQFRAQNFAVTVQTVASALMLIAGALTVGVGCLLAMDGAISMGALIGATTMVWRGLGPIQSAFLGLSRLGQSIDSLQQINQLMRLDLERQPGRHATIYRTFKGKVSLDGVGLRYAGQIEPALKGLNLRIKAGETIAITGNSGAGKSTLLKVISGLYRPQAGSIFIDDLNARQLDVGELRHAIGVVPQKPSFFYGTISQNLRLAHPTASDEDIEKALEKAGLLDQVQALEGGTGFRLMGSRESRFSEGFLKQLMLARAYVKFPSLYLLDEPGAQLDVAGDQALVKAIEEQKGKVTTIMATSRPSHMRLADRVIVLDRGQIVLQGPPDEVVPLVLKPANNPNLALKVAG